MNIFIFAQILIKLKVMKRSYLLLKSKLFFKKWQSKSYAVFNSLGKEVKILSLTTVYFSVFGYAHTLAQINTDTINKIIRLNEVKVSARRAPSLFSEVGRVITVIPRQEILKLPVQSVDELLRYAVSVDVRQRGPVGIQSDVSIRGGSFNQVMILLNGINITDPQTGHHNLNLPVDLQSIERIEILEGPGARVYGPNAFSGAINVITSDLKEKNITAKAMAGQYGLYNIGVSSTLVSKKFKNYFAGNFSSSNGYIENTDFKTLQLFYNGKLSFANESLDFQLGYSNKAFGANSFYTPKYPEQFEQTKTTFASVKSSLGKRIKITPALYWRRNQDRFELFRYESPDWYAGHNYHLTDVFGGNLNFFIPWSLGKTSFGGEVRRESIWSNNIGNIVDEPKPVLGVSGEFFDKFYSRTSNSFFIEHVFVVNKFSFSAGVLVNNNSALDETVQFFPGMDASFWINPRMKLFASINKSLRMPTFTELFYTGPVNIGNENLKPEEAVTYEGGGRYLAGFMENKLSVFYRKSSNLIDWGRMDSTEIYVTRNLSDMNSVGVEFATTVDMQKLIQNQNFFQSVEFGYNFICQDKESLPGYESVYVMDYLKQKLHLSIKNRLISKLSSDISLLYQERNGTYTVYVLDEGTFVGSQKEYEPFVTVDMRLQWLADKYMVYLDINNVFNKKYFDIGNVLQPGIWVKAGIKIDIKYR